MLPHQEEILCEIRGIGKWFLVRIDAAVFCSPMPVPSYVRAGETEARWPHVASVSV